MRAPSRILRAVAAAAGIVWLGLGLVDRSAWRLAPIVAFVAIFGLFTLLPRAASTCERAFVFVPWRAFVACCALVAFVVSLWLVRGPLHDRVLAIDAAVYLMQARALAHGALAMPVSPPLLQASGRFLLEGPDGRIFGVFPPGYPLLLVPFVWAGAPMLSGPVLAACLVLVQARLAERIAPSEIARRLAIFLPLLSFARAIQTADLLSHALVAVLVTASLALALRKSLGPWSALALGFSVGLATSARLLDGLVLGIAVAAILGWRRRLAASIFAVCGAALPLIFTALEQRAATGGWHLTQSVYFARSDWPPDCHRLGFGKDIGCTIEHAMWMSQMGDDGYGLSDAVRVLRERGVQLAKDLFGTSPLALLVVLPAIVRPRVRDVAGIVFVSGFSLAYGLFYFGNVPFYGARHLFPIAPLAWILAARGAVHPFPKRRAPLVLATIGACAFGQWSTWKHETHAVGAFQGGRPDLRLAAEREHLDRAIVRSNDPIAVIAATDTIADGDRLLFVQDDRSGLLELRRAHPDLPVYIAPHADTLARLMLGPPAPGLLVEIEQAWPTFQRPSRLSAHPVDTRLLEIPDRSASGRAVLLVEHASVGSTLEIPFALATAQTLTLRLDALVDPAYGDWDVVLDGETIGRHQGYAPERAAIKGAPLVVRTLEPKRHTLVLRCAGKNSASKGWGGAFDALVGW